MLETNFLAEIPFHKALVGKMALREHMKRSVLSVTIGHQSDKLTEPNFFSLPLHELICNKHILKGNPGQILE